MLLIYSNFGVESRFPDISSKMEDLLQGVCLVFPDGVTVNIKKCLPEGLMKLIRQYYGKSEEGGVPCFL